LAEFLRREKATRFRAFHLGVKTDAEGERALTREELYGERLERKLSRLSKLPDATNSR